jgi:serine/threonine protein kinase
LADAIRDYHQHRGSGQADPLRLHELVGGFVAVCNAVAYAQSRGVLHRDLKPQNVILGDFGETKLSDWCVAKLMGQKEAATGEEAIALETNRTRDQTIQGQILGKPAYIVPEQAEGQFDLVDAGTDVYGLGAVLYEILTGKALFPGTDAPKVLQSLFRNEWARTSINLAVVYGASGRADRTTAAYQELLAGHAPLVRDHPEVIANALVHSSLLINRGDRAPEEGELPAALQDYCRAIGVLEGVLGRKPREVSGVLYLRIVRKARAEVLSKLERYTEAMEDWDKALAQDAGKMPTLLPGRANTLAHSGNYEQAVRVAEKVSGGNKLGPPKLFGLACVYSLAAAAVGKDQKLPPSARREQAEAYASRAVQRLRQAIAGGFATQTNIKKDTDLDRLRARADFESLLHSMNKK